MRFYDFNPRTREGCDNMFYECKALTNLISIHAPVKGATEDVIKEYGGEEVFQSTHP